MWVVFMIRYVLSEEFYVVDERCTIPDESALDVIVGTRSA